IVGPKRAGKTTLSFHLLRSGRCRWIANDRLFVAPSSAGFTARGMPTPVKILEPTLRQFPELGRGLRSVERPYLHALDEIAVPAREERAPSDEFALSPAQLAHLLRVEPLASASLASILFPEIRTNLEGWEIQRLAPPEASERLWANLYGKPWARSEST